MAYSSRGSSSSGSRSRPSSGARYGGGGGGGGGGSNNAVAIVIAVVVLAAVVGVMFILNKKDKPKPPPPSTNSSVPQTPVGPVKPEPPKKAPLPQLPADVVARAKNLIPEVKSVNEKGTALFNEALKAKDAGDADTWQAKMEEARELMKIARDKWIVIEEEVQTIASRAMPLQGWTEDTATDGLFDAYLKEESRLVRTLIDEPLSRMAKAGRSR
jgi:hypothetical protein